jgi:hypothetical protein
MAASSPNIPANGRPFLDLFENTLKKLVHDESTVLQWEDQQFEAEKQAIGALRVASQGVIDPVLKGNIVNALDFYMEVSRQWKNLRDAIKTLKTFRDSVGSLYAVYAGLPDRIGYTNGGG